MGEVRARYSFAMKRNGGLTAEARLVAACRARGVRVATAESCTGGLVAGRITAVPGASAVFLGGVVSYANAAKRDLLGVPQEILDRHGAVSGACAEAMAAGARARFGADAAVSVTGIAGPDGGTPEKPVGLVWFGLATAAGARAERCVFAGDREAVRRQASERALELLAGAADGGGHAADAFPGARPEEGVVPLGEADVPTVLALMRAFYAHENFAFDPEASGRMLRYLLAHPEEGAVFLACESRRAAGYLALTRCYSLEFGGPFVLLDEIFLLPEAQGRGLGKRLLDAAEAYCRRHGAGYLRLEVQKKNRRAIEVYREYGFRTEDRFLMSLPVAGGGSHGVEGGPNG